MNEGALDWLKGVAPTVASALGGPLAGLAVTAIGGALGWKDTTKDDVNKLLSTGSLTGEQLMAVKKAELELKQHESDNGFKFAELEIRDRESARAMQVALRSSTPEILSWLIIIATLVLEGITLLYGIAPGVSELVAGRILGTLDAAFVTVLTFWLGTSSSSRAKDTVISKLS